MIIDYLKKEIIIIKCKLNFSEILSVYDIISANVRNVKVDEWTVIYDK